MLLTLKPELLKERLDALLLESDKESNNFQSFPLSSLVQETVAPLLTVYSRPSLMA